MEILQFQHSLDPKVFVHISQRLDFRPQSGKVTAGTFFVLHFAAKNWVDGTNKNGNQTSKLKISTYNHGTKCRSQSTMNMSQQNKKCVPNISKQYWKLPTSTMNHAQFWTPSDATMPHPFGARVWTGTNGPLSEITEWDTSSKNTFTPNQSYTKKQNSHGCHSWIVFMDY